MILNAFKQCNTLLVKDYTLLKIIFIGLTLYLIIDEFCTFFIRKPTLVSHEKRTLGAEDIPEIFLCPEPSIDLTVLASKGYHGMLGYFRGRYNAHHMQQIGWVGNKSDAENVRSVFREISVLKTIKDCQIEDGVKSKVYYRGAYDQSWKNPKFELTKALYPYHLCCKVIPPDESQPVVGLRFIYSIGSVNHTFKRFKAFMTANLTASFFTQHKNNMMGDPIVSSEYGMMNYKVKVMEYVKLENDPSYPCIEYKTRIDTFSPVCDILGAYGKCMEMEIVRQNSHFLNCTPPWMTDSEDLWCRGKYKIDSEEAASNYGHFLHDIGIGEADPGECSIPCNNKRYQVKEIGLKEHVEKGLELWFEREVYVTKSKFILDAKTMMSEIGGFIGISKNFLWVLILFLSSFGILMSHLKHKL